MYSYVSIVFDKTILMVASVFNIMCYFLRYEASVNHFFELRI